MPEALFDKVPRGAPGSEPHHYHAPAARFFDPAKLRSDAQFQWKPGKFLLGVIDALPRTDEKGRPYVTGGRPIGVDDDRHILTVAGNRSGKGRASIVTNTLHYPGSMLLNDTKGELASITARRRKEMGQDVHVLDPFGIARGYPHTAGLLAGFNSIKAMRDGHLVEDAALISDALVVSSGKEMHFDDSARTLIEGVTLHVRTHDAFKDRRNLLTVRRLIGGNAKNLDLLKMDMEKNKAANGVIMASAADFFDRPDRERGSVLSTARRHLKFIDLLAEAKFGQRTLAQHDFNLSDLKKKPTTIYLCLPARHVGTCNRWLRLFMNLTLQSMEQTHRRNMPGGVAVLGVLDEFAAGIGYMKQIEDAAGQIAGFGFRMWIVAQDLGQLKALYEDRWETFIGNAGIVQAFGNTDLTTLEWIAKRSGRTTIRVRSDKPMTVNEINAGGGQAWSTEIYDLLGVDEIARLFSREDELARQLVFVGGLPAMVLQRSYYDKNAMFSNLYDNVPDTEGDDL